MIEQQALDPTAKIKTPELYLDDASEGEKLGTKVQVEVLAQGQQFVAFGMHPDTKAAYVWTDKGPDEVPVFDLPTVTAEALQSFVAEAEAMIRAAGGLTKQERDPKPAPEPPPAVAGVPLDFTAGQGASPRPGASCGDGSPFFRNVNTAALQNIGAWVRPLFPQAKPQAGTGGWRVSSKDLGRTLEEDLSIHPNGIQDFGEEKPQMAIDLVMRYASAPDAKAAAFWLCETLRVSPQTLGWRDAPKPDAESPKKRRNKALTAINAAAVKKIEAWLPDIFPDAVKNETNNVWSANRPNGSTFLTHQNDRAFEHQATRLACDNKIAKNATEAAFWVCEKIGVEPDSFGFSFTEDREEWAEKKTKKNDKFKEDDEFKKPPPPPGFDVAWGNALRQIRISARNPPQCFTSAPQSRRH